MESVDDTTLYLEYHDKPSVAKRLSVLQREIRDFIGDGTIWRVKMGQPRPPLPSDEVVAQKLNDPARYLDGVAELLVAESSAAGDGPGMIQSPCEQARLKVGDLAHAGHLLAATLERVVTKWPSDGDEDDRQHVKTTAERLRRYAEGVTPDPRTALDEAPLYRNYSARIGSIAQGVDEALTILCEMGSPLHDQV